MGGARPRRERARRGNPSAIPSEAAARPLGVARGEVQAWRWSGGARIAAGARARGRQRDGGARLLAQMGDAAGRPSGGLAAFALAELADPAAEAQAIALALARGAGDAGQDGGAGHSRPAARGPRLGAACALGHRGRRQRRASRCRRPPPGRLLLGIAAAAAEELAPVPLLALLKHPLVGGEGEERRAGSSTVRALDLSCAGRGRRPGLRASTRISRHEHARVAASRGRRSRRIDGLLREPRYAVATRRSAWRGGADACRRSRRGAGPTAAWRPSCSPSCRRRRGARADGHAREDAVPLLRQLLDGRAVRPPYGGHPRIFIWGLLEARLQRADLVVLGGLNEGVWPALPAPDPWLPPKVRATLGMPTLEFRIGLAAHDFASALGAPEVLITRARRDAARRPSPRGSCCGSRRSAAACRATVVLERLARALDDPGPPQPVDRPAPSPPAEQRPEQDLGHRRRPAQGRSVRFLCAGDPQLRQLDPVDADHTAALEGHGGSQGASRSGSMHDDCDPDKLRPRAERCSQDEAIHPMLRALWAPRLLEAIDWIARAGAREPGARAGGRSRRRSTAKRRSPASPSTAASTGSTGSPTAASRSSTTRPAQPPIAEGGRRGLCAAARPARPDRPRRRVRRRERRSRSVRILVAGRGTAASSGS